MNEEQKDILIAALKSMIATWFGSITSLNSPSTIMHHMTAAAMATLLLLHDFKEINMDGTPEDLSNTFNRWMMEGSISFVRYSVEHGKAPADAIDFAISTLEEKSKEYNEELNDLVQEALTTLKEFEDTHNPRLQVWKEHFDEQEDS